MFKDDFFDEWLEEEVRRVQNKIKAGQALDADDKVLLILKAQVNHFLHLDIDLRGEVKTLREDMDKRFEQVDKRFEQMDKRLEQMQVDMDKRFEQVDKRFEQMRVDMDKRFEQVDKRFEQTQEDLKRLYQAINTQTWKMIGAIGLIVILARLAGGLHLPAA